MFFVIHASMVSMVCSHIDNYHNHCSFSFLFLFVCLLLTVCGHKHKLILSCSEDVYPEFKGLWHCDGCGKNGGVKSQLFHCKECGDYDLCSECAYSRVIISPSFQDDDCSDSSSNDDDDDDLRED